MKIEMSAMEYFKTRNRMINKCIIDCQDCPLSDLNNGTNFGCAQLEIISPEKAIEIVYNWGKEHPIKTMMQDFFEKFPNAPKGEDGTPECCPYQCGYVEAKDGFCGCEDPDFDCFKCWSRPIE